MRIVAIRGENLASLAGPFALELEEPPLRDLGLFAIHGPVGAGKSTLLDAMCLALFGRTPRLSNLGGALQSDDDDGLRTNDPRTLIRRGTSGGFAEVDFIGVDGRLYRARWEVRRSKPRGKGMSAKPGRLKDAHHSLEDLDSQTTLGGTKTETLAAVSAHLGLTFEELCRSVLLAQGGFQSFLAARPNERAALLERVTGTDIYSRLSMAAHERARDARDTSQRLQHQRDALGVADDDARTALERAVVFSQSAAAEADSAVRHLAQKLERQQARTAWRAARDACRQADDDDRAAATTAQAMAEARAAVRDERKQLGPWLQARRHALEALTRAEGAVDVATAAFAAAEQRARHAEAALPAARERVAHARAILARSTAVVDEATAALGPFAHAPTLAAAQALVDDLAAAHTRARGARAIAAAARDAAEAAQREVDIAATAVEDATRAVDAALPAGVDRDDLEAVRARRRQRLARLTRRQAQRLDEAARVQLQVRDRLLTAAALVTTRDALGPDDDCPLCGAGAVHQHREAAAAMSAVVDDAEASWTAAREAAEQAHRIAAEDAAEARAAWSLVDDAVRATAPSDDDHDDDGDDDDDDDDNVLPSLHALRAEVAALDAALPRLRALRRAAQRLADAEGASEEARHTHGLHLASLENQVGHAQGVARQVARVLFGAGGGDEENDNDDDNDDDNDNDDVDVDVDVDVDQLLRRARETLQARGEAVVALRRHHLMRNGAVDGVAQAESALTALETSLQGIVQKRETAAAQRAAADAALLSARLAVEEDEASPKSRYLSIGCAYTPETGASDARAAVVASQQALDDAVDAADEQAQRASERAAAARATAVAARVALEERTARLQALGGMDLDDDDDDDDGAELTLPLLEARRTFETTQRDAATARARLEHDDALREKVRALDEALTNHERRSAVWIELSSLIGSADGARFRHFAQGLTLDALIGHANEHLKLLAPRYRLQRTVSTQQKHDLDLVVVDVESGDEVRSTSTLSGGETFLVSLALALGLSSLSTNEGARGRVESLFIDEGFSALDQETLDVALTAFEALRQSGRQIGVISHVPLLVDRLGAQVRVIPTGGGASRVEVHAG